MLWYFYVFLSTSRSKNISVKTIKKENVENNGHLLTRASCKTLSASVLHFTSAEYKLVLELEPTNNVTSFYYLSWCDNISSMRLRIEVTLSIYSFWEFLEIPLLLFLCGESGEWKTLLWLELMVSSLFFFYLFSNSIWL